MIYGFDNLRAARASVLFLASEAVAHAMRGEHAHAACQFSRAAVLAGECQDYVDSARYYDLAHNQAAMNRPGYLRAA